MAKPGKKKKVLFVLEIVVLLLFIGGLYVYGQISSRLDKIQQPELKRETIPVNPEAPKMTGYKTYVLFGIDSRGADSKYSAQNSDTMIVVSVNNDTKEVRMDSVYRDTLLNVGDDTYTKANAAYALGGPEQAISMLNTNLDLDISDYATADFSALVEVVDDLGGLDIPLSYAEIEHMNNYCVETSELTGKDYTPIEKPEPKPEPGAWKCSCGATVTGNFCPECGSKRPAEDEGWTCSCGAVNKGKFCTNCGAKKPAGAPLYRCDKCGWEPKDPKNPPRFCPECGDIFDENDRQ